MTDQDFATESLLPFDAPAAQAERLQLDLDGWEGPLDLLLTLARNQKVDLKAISILQLVEQYLDHIERAQALRLEVAADYLVMAAWMALLKSALLLPRDPEVEPSPEELALRLHLRLQRLAAMRDAAARLSAGNLLGRDVFRRGNPEGLRVLRTHKWQASLFDVIAAYGQVQLRSVPPVHMVQRRPIVTLEAALLRLEAVLGTLLEWTSLAALVPEAEPEMRKSGMASSFVAALELARTGRIELQQSETYAPVYLRRAS